MSNQKSGTKKRKSSHSAQNIASSAVGTVINVVLVVVAAMLIYRFSVSAYRYGIRIFGEPPVSAQPGTEVTVTVTDGMDFDGIAGMIYEKGLVREERLFRIQIALSNYSEDGFQEGTYTLSTAMTAEEMMDIMAGVGSGDDS